MSNLAAIPEKPELAEAARKTPAKADKAAETVKKPSQKDGSPTVAGGGCEA